MKSSISISSRLLFFSLLLTLLVLWFAAAIGTDLCTTDLFPPHFYTQRGFAALIHASFFAAILFTLWFGRAAASKSKLVVLLTFSLFAGLLYETDLWPPMIATFVRAPWGNENERGPAISNPSAYSVYTWEWEVGPSGVKE